MNCWRTQRGRGLIRSLDFCQWWFFLRLHPGEVAASTHCASLSWIRPWLLCKAESTCEWAWQLYGTLLQATREGNVTRRGNHRIKLAAFPLPGENESFPWFHFSDV